MLYSSARGISTGEVAVTLGGGTSLSGYGDSEYKEMLAVLDMMASFGISLLFFALMHFIWQLRISQQTLCKDANTLSQCLMLWNANRFYFIFKKIFSPPLHAERFFLLWR